MSGYSREEFPHWRDTGNGCDGREAALINDGKNVVKGSGCEIKSGIWDDPYTGKTFRAPGDLDADHVVPLAEAWRSGANGWTRERRQQYANDVNLVLLMVDASANRAKGDKDPAAWKPPQKSYWPAYAQRWIAIKKQYGLTVDQAEYNALNSML
jgi:hypothetical protein